MSEPREQLKLSEHTKVQLSVTSWIHVILLIVTIVSCYFGLQASINTAVQAGAKNTNDIINIQAQQGEMKLQLQQLLDDVKYFHQQYNEDMNKYVRNGSSN